MIIEDILDFKQNQLYFLLRNFTAGCDVYLKLEGFNLAGSIKLKSALTIITGLEQRGEIAPGRNSVIESSSGNMAIALSLICKARGYGFLCVLDPNVPKRSIELIELYGGRIEMVTERDENGGYLLSRIRRIQEIVKGDSRYVWTNQYANRDNIKAHYETTAVEIHEQFPKLDYLFIGTGTTGTLGGCASYFEERSPLTEIIAVDPVGSVTFGHPSEQRRIPGLGTSRAPELASLENVSRLIRVSEPDTILMCRRVLEEYSLFIGPSTGTVLHGVIEHFRSRPVEKSQTVVAVSPDFGDKYLDTVYNEGWVRRNYPGHPELADRVETPVESPA